MRCGRHPRRYRPPTSLVCERVVFIDFPGPLLVPIPVFVLAVFRSAFELRLREVYLVPSEAFVLRELVPGQWVIIFPDAHESAETHYDVGDLPGVFIDHYPPNGADVLVIRAVYVSSLDLVASDERRGFTSVGGLSYHGVLLL